MLNWEQTEYGFKFTFSGHITKQEVSKWLVAIKKDALKFGENFNVFVDMREMKILPVECKELVAEAQMFCKENGMVRSVVILDDKLTAMQFRLIAKKTGIYQWERYIEASANPDWEQKGLDWIIFAKDPDEKISTDIDSIPSK